MPALLDVTAPAPDRDFQPVSPAPTAAEAAISVQSVTKTFGKFRALDHVSLDIAKGELLALLGPSGSGKSTLLRMIAGLDYPDDSADAAILFNGTDVTEQSAYARRAGFVFQSYALFQHLTVFDNVAFGLDVMKRSERPSKEKIAERVHYLLEAVQLANLAKRYPAQLSGGQRQRIALARALAINPNVLLLDEPFGALDAKVRKQLRRWLRAFHEKDHTTTIFVTHDQEEAFELADRVVILAQGKIQQIGTPDEIRRAPANDFVRDFVSDSLE